MVRKVEPGKRQRRLLAHTKDDTQFLYRDPETGQLILDQKIPDKNEPSGFARLSGRASETELHDARDSDDWVIIGPKGATLL
jgi:hypothetical protein